AHTAEGLLAGVVEKLRQKRPLTKPSEQEVCRNILTQAEEHRGGGGEGNGEGEEVAEVVRAYSAEAEQLQEAEQQQERAQEEEFEMVEEEERTRELDEVEDLGYARDDEPPTGWPVSTLSSPPRPHRPFYPLSDFRVFKSEVCCQIEHILH
ncbi:MAG: hypothetical protein SGPRY_002522, partial [Prymnesium sp.]